MRSEYGHKFNPDLVEMNEKLRKDVMRSLEPHGAKTIADLEDMTEAERAKWFFWNMHENLDEFRKLEPTLIGQILCTEMTVTEGQAMDGDHAEVEKRLSFKCRWHMRLVYSAYQNEEAYPMGEGAVDLLISDTPPTHPGLQDKQKGYLDSDSSLYPNHLYLYGWVTEPVWHAIEERVFHPSPNCHTDIMLRDNYVFPVKAGFDFVVGPPGSIGITNIEFRAVASSGERRTERRTESLPR